VIKRLLLLLLMLGPAGHGLAAVYKWVDEQGNVIYSDQPRPGAEQLKVPPVPTYSAPPLPPRSSGAGAPKAEAPAYTHVSIVQPSHDSTVRNNAGVVVISALLEPPLRTDLGHKIVLSMDGTPIGEPGPSTAIQLSNVDRGTHTLQVSVVDDAGKVLVTSDPSTFHMRRVSILHPKPAPPPPPPAN